MMASIGNNNSNSNFADNLFKGPLLEFDAADFNNSCNSFGSFTFCDSLMSTMTAETANSSNNTTPAAAATMDALMTSDAPPQMVVSDADTMSTSSSSTHSQSAMQFPASPIQPTSMQAIGSAQTVTPPTTHSSTSSSSSLKAIFDCNNNDGRMHPPFLSSFCDDDDDDDDESEQRNSIMDVDMEPVPIEVDRITIVSKVEPNEFLLRNSIHSVSSHHDHSDHSADDEDDIGSFFDVLRPLLRKRKMSVSEPAEEEPSCEPVPSAAGGSSKAAKSKKRSQTRTKQQKLLKHEQSRQRQQQLPSPDEAPSSSSSRNSSERAPVSPSLESKFRAQPKAKRRRIQFPMDAPKRAMESYQTDKIKCHQESQWRLRFNELMAYREEHGHCSVPHAYSDNVALAQWIKRQRYQFKLKLEGRHTTLTNCRQQALDDIGFIWDSHHALWEERFAEMKKYKARTGTCIIAARNKEHPTLAIWVKCQRRQYRLLELGQRTNITQERINRLNAIGFVWDPRKGK
eukprot:CAMPEP_0119548082 /NCGR_PEP_ID=MMETSP1352-20130426/2078_1 /TAXON_ID=265584 /ORGANISM="Stauroneis constricta, Strain CCMP1120" /LENGTH=511 /DNA_ID=CAMNT_0007593255 /DNA_START=88 /DNA_END=1623 /DNA_ORIENTATION=+